MTAIVVLHSDGQLSTQKEGDRERMSKSAVQQTTELNSQICIRSWMCLMLSGTIQVHERDALTDTTSDSHWCQQDSKARLVGMWPRSRGRLEAFQRLASVSPRKNFQTPRSRLGLGLQRLGLGSQGLSNNLHIHKSLSQCPCQVITAEWVLTEHTKVANKYKCYNDLMPA